MAASPGWADGRKSGGGLASVPWHVRVWALHACVCGRGWPTGGWYEAAVRPWAKPCESPGPRPNPRLHGAGCFELDVVEKKILHLKSGQPTRNVSRASCFFWQHDTLSLGFLRTNARITKNSTLNTQEPQTNHECLDVRLLQTPADVNILNYIA